jgi:hypothetical protein
MSSPYCSIAVANLATFNPAFDHFVVEMHLDNSGTKLSQTLHIKGTWVAANKDYEQTSIEFFRNATLGTTYYFRAAVADKQSNLSPYSVWVSFTPGSATAPNPSYTPVVTSSLGGIQVNVGPSSMTNVDHFEGYWNLTDAAPSSSTAPNLPRSNDGTTWAINLSSGQTAYIWCRAVDASGNRQAWTQLGGSGVGYEFSGGNVFQVPPGTLDGVPDGTNTPPRRATLVGTLVNRPTPITPGRLYHATDSGANGTTYRDTGSAWVKVGVGQLDDLDEGVTYNRVVASDQTSNRIDFSKALLNKQLDNIPDGSTYNRFKAANMYSGGVSSAHIGSQLGALATTVVLVQDDNNHNTGGWSRVATATIQLGAGVNSITLAALCPSQSAGSTSAGFDQMGYAIYSGSPPATPQASFYFTAGAGGSQNLTLNSPTTGTVTLALYIHDNGVANFSAPATPVKLSAILLQPFASGTLT